MVVPNIELRANGNGMPTLAGHFAVFNKWAEIDSLWEGPFLERIAPGAFAKTIRENRSSIKVLYDHGFDPTLGNKPLGPIRVLKEDDKGAAYEVPLIDTDYNRDFIVPAATEGLLGASFRFAVEQESWEKKEGEMDKRTIEEVRLFEFGPVTFPAYEAATAGVRSRADMELWERLDKKGRKDLIRLMQQAHRGAAEGTPSVEDGGEPADATPFLDQARKALEGKERAWPPQP
jgi:HK97 family phage prohead protease